MLKGNLTKILLAVILLTSAAGFIQTYRLSVSKSKATLLQSQIDTLRRDKEYTSKLYRSTLEELSKARGDHDDTLRQLQEARSNDPIIDDWLSQPIPDGVRDILR